MYDISLEVANVCEQIYFLTGMIYPVSAVESYWPIVSNSLWFDHLTQSNPMDGYLSRKIYASWNDPYSTMIYPFYESLV